MPSPRLNSWLSLPFIAVIWAYRVTLSPMLGRHCRFEPTCSRYALDAYHEHGPIRGTALTARRLLRCHPFSRGGYDPVPVAESDKARQPGGARQPEEHADDASQPPAG